MERERERGGSGPDQLSRVFVDLLEIGVLDEVGAGAAAVEALQDGLRGAVEEVGRHGHVDVVDVVGHAHDARRLVVLGEILVGKAGANTCDER